MHILILGAGYAGLRVALELDKLLPHGVDQPQVTLIDQHSYHQDICLLHLAATASVDDGRVVIPLDTILRQRPSIQFCQGQVVRIEPSQHQVVLDDAQIIPYDILVIALGALSSCREVPGACNHTLPLRSYNEALSLRHHIIERFREAAEEPDPHRRRILLTFAIAGGGFTGCQLAGELPAWVGKLAREFGVPRSEVRMAIVEATDLLLSEFGSWATREAEEVLDRQGVSVYLNTPVECVEEGVLFVEGEHILPAGTLIWAVGICAPALLTDSGLPTDARGRLLVDRYLCVQEHEGVIFALGDCASIPDTNGGVVPTTASYAVRQGEYLAQALRDRLQGRGVRPYEPSYLGQIVSLGSDYAVGNPLGVRTTGLAAAMLKQGIEQWYQSTLW